MKYRRFGRTDWQVGEIGYGMWGMAGWTGSDDDESLTGLQLAVDLGCNFFDTAWAYGDGHSERLLGRLIAANPGKTLYAARLGSSEWIARLTPGPTSADGLDELMNTLNIGVKLWRSGT